MAMDQRQDKLRKILLDPSDYFASPANVLEDKELTQEEKVEILRRWEYDACEESVAAEEGMRDTDGELLQQILRALESLVGKIDSDHTPPTKQGGLDYRSVKPRANDK